MPWQALPSAMGARLQRSLPGETRNGLERLSGLRCEAAAAPGSTVIWPLRGNRAGTGPTSPWNRCLFAEGFRGGARWPAAPMPMLASSRSPALASRRASGLSPGLLSFLLKLSSPGDGVVRMLAATGFKRLLFVSTPMAGQIRLLQVAASAV